MKEKRSFPPGTMLYPAPVVMVSCGILGEQMNIITVGWTGIINTNPPMTYVSVRKSRYSHGLLVEGREFVINLTTEQLVRQADYCGVRSGREENKFLTQQLTPIPATKIRCPMIQESPVNLECKVIDVRSFPSHDMFLAEIVAFHADERLIDETGKIRMEDADLICYNHGAYYALRKESLGRFGFSVMKPKTKKRILGKDRQGRHR